MKNAEIGFEFYKRRKQGQIKNIAIQMQKLNGNILIIDDEEDVLLTTKVILFIQKR